MIGLAALSLPEEDYLDIPVLERIDNDLIKPKLSQREVVAIDILNRNKAQTYRLKDTNYLCWAEIKDDKLLILWIDVENGIKLHRIQDILDSNKELVFYLDILRETKEK